MEDYKLANLKKYAATHEQVKFVTHPSKISEVESFRRRSSLVAVAGERILDIGGGAGIWTTILQEEKMHLEIFVVDISRAILQERPPSDRGVVGDIEHLPFQGDSFDRAFFFASLHHVRNTRSALAEALRVIRVGGHIVLTEPISLRLLLFNKNIEPVDEAEFCFSILYLLRLLHQLGLHVCSISYHGFFKRFLPLRPSVTCYRICNRLDEILNAIPILRKMGMLGNKVTIIAQKQQA
jgi:SAM-dependent methyltransferase